MTESESGLTGPLVSVIIACYNHERFIRETIESVWAQTYPRVELIVVDDASRDGSFDVLKSAACERPFQVLRNEQNRGLNATLERGLALATGEYAVLFGSDDVMLPTRIADQVQLVVGRALDGAYATSYILHPDGRRELVSLDHVETMFREGTILRHLQTSDTSGPLLQSGLFRTEVLRALAPIRHRFKSDDWALAISLLERYRIGFLNKPVFLYRRHDDNSYRNYWRTFPMRVEVVSLLTPEPLRLAALSNLFESQSDYLAHDGRRRESLRFLFAAFVFDPSAARLLRRARNVLLTRLGRLRARLRPSRPKH